MRSVRPWNSLAARGHYTPVGFVAGVRSLMKARLLKILSIALLFLPIAAVAQPVPLSYPSPDGTLIATVVPVGRDAGATHIDDNSTGGENSLEYECRVEIRTRKGHKIWSEDFSSPDHDHGRGVGFAAWSPDSKYFVFSTVSSGGHHPWQFYTYAYGRMKDAVYLLDSFVGEIIDKTFTVTAPNTFTFKIFDRDTKEANSSSDFPARHVTVSLDTILTAKSPPEKYPANPPMRGYYQ